MKTELFKTAWELFKKFNMSFSQALIESWKTIKRELVRQKVLKMDLSDFKMETEFKSRTKNLKTVFFNLRSQVSLSVNNSGASFDYGTGMYNGD